MTHRTQKHKRKDGVTSFDAKTIKASFVLRGSTLRAWARKNGYNTTTVYRAIHGERSGRVSVEIMSKLQEEIKR